MEKRPWKSNKTEPTVRDVVASASGKIIAHDENGITVSFSEDPDQLLERLMSEMRPEGTSVEVVEERLVYIVNDFEIGNATLHDADTGKPLQDRSPAMKLFVNKADEPDKEIELHMVMPEVKTAGNLGMNLLRGALPPEIFEKIVEVLSSEGIVEEDS